MVNFKINTKTAASPTYKPAQSYIDMCLIDSRLEIIDENNNGHINTINYDSDHNAIQFTVKLPEKLSKQFFKPRNNIQYIYKKTNWTKFNKILEKKLNNNIST